MRQRADEIIYPHAALIPSDQTILRSAPRQN